MPNATEEKGCVLERERERACCSVDRRKSSRAVSFTCLRAQGWSEARAHYPQRRAFGSASEFSSRAPGIKRSLRFDTSVQWGCSWTIGVLKHRHSIV